MRPIFIFGFGRSGTTWLSDIISKSLGGIILFEPFHPTVFSYGINVNEEATLHKDNRILKKHVLSALRGDKKDRWLLRNHLSTPLSEVDQEFIDQIWKECPILGFKSIRNLYQLDWFIKEFSPLSILLVRHPLAVMASIKNRPNFRKEIGLDMHWAMCKNAISSSDYERFEDVISSADSPLKKEVVMWMLSTLHLCRIHNQMKIPIWTYENFYLTPYKAVKQLLDYMLPNKSVSIHPSYIFTPSMVTLRTIHQFEKDKMLLRKFPQFFWEQILTSEEVITIRNLIDQISSKSPELRKFLVKNKYIGT